jgi:hypothetical protein
LATGSVGVQHALFRPVWHRVACLSKLTGNWFTFSSDGYSLSYTDVTFGAS